MISIIVPVYNVENYLDDCIRSIVMQTFTDWELLLIDDGSTDSSPLIAKDWKNKDERIKYFRKENGGVSTARNFGIDHARGEYIMFVDSDDICSTDILKSLFLAMTPTCDLVACEIYRFKAENEISESQICNKLSLSSLNDIYAHFENHGLLHPPYAKLFRKEIIRNNNLRFDERLSLGEDMCFNLDYLQYVSTAIVISSALYFYRDTAGSLTKNIRLDYADIQMYLLDRKFGFIESNNIQYDYSAKAPDIIRDMFLSLCRSNGTDEKKFDSIQKLRQHKVMQICGEPSNIYNSLLITAIRRLPAKLLIKILKWRNR